MPLTKILAEFSKRLSLRHPVGRKKNHFARIGSLIDARAGDVILRLIRAQGRVVRLEARTRSSCEYDGVESEADMLKLSVEHYHEISQIPMRHSAPLRLKGQNCNTILMSKVHRAKTAGR